ncbi:MAG: thiamine pyrophosphate-binding protein [Chloroflexi bacterium]|nr:thiamine pyrophosphate-binding protein [Chloroflexota bacterium]
MAKVTGGQLVARSLAAQGVRIVFSLCGNHLLSTYDAFLDAGIRVVDTRHEAAAAHMAEGWSRVTGEPGVCLVTGGPGHTNALTGLLTAQATATPLILLSGQSELSRRGMGVMQEAPQVETAAPLSKWAGLALETRRIPEYLDTAFRIACSDRHGPVHLSLPVDLLDQAVDEDGVSTPTPFAWRRPLGYGDPGAVEQAMELLAGAERPVVIAGAGAWHSQAGDALQRFVELTRLPLFTVETARGIVSDDHPLSLGYADPIFNEAARAFSLADAFLVLGKDLDFRLAFGQPPLIPAGAAVIQVDAAAAVIGHNRRVQAGIVADVAAAVEQLIVAARRRAWRDLPWTDELRSRRRRQLDDYAATAAAIDDLPAHPIQVVEAVRPFVDDQTIVVVDGGDFVQWARAGLPAKRAGGWLRLGPMATLGAGTPFALAAKLARPEASVLLITGDGSIGFSLMEFDTAVRHRLPFVAVVGNDAAWGVEKQYQLGLYGPDRLIASELRPLRYDRLVQALGGYGERAEAPSAIGPAIQRAIASGMPACVDVSIRSVPSPSSAAVLARLRAERP